jgi:hypothetical protein
MQQDALAPPATTVTAGTTTTATTVNEPKLFPVTDFTAADVTVISDTTATTSTTTAPPASLAVVPFFSDMDLHNSSSACMHEMQFTGDTEYSANAMQMAFSDGMTASSGNATAATATGSGAAAGCSGSALDSSELLMPHFEECDDLCAEDW